MRIRKEASITKQQNNRKYYILVVNVNGLNSLTKRHRMEDWIKKKNLTTCSLKEMHLIHKDPVGSG
jgi:hypothetical protein